MTNSDYELVAKTLCAHFTARIGKYPLELPINNYLQEISLALGLAFEEDSAQRDQESMQDEIAKSFDLTQFLKECEP